MIRALREQGSYENIFNSYSQGYFKFASRNFYSEFLAAMRTAKRFESLPRLPLERPEATSTFRLKEPTPLSRLLTAIKLSKSEFLRLNPALLDPVENGQQPVPKGYLVRTPAARQPQKTGPALQHGQAATATPIARTQAATTRYTVRKADTLASIARKFSCSPQAIQAANSGKRLTVVQEGEQLAIPGRLK